MHLRAFTKVISLLLRMRHLFWHLRYHIPQAGPLRGFIRKATDAPPVQSSSARTATTRNTGAVRSTDADVIKQLLSHRLLQPRSL